jgi:acyl dehydratase
MPGHHQPAYAKRQGQRDIFTNTLFHQSFIDRVVTDWAGPETFIARRRMTMLGPMYPGHTLRGSGTVIEKYTDDEGGGCADLEIAIATADGFVTRAEVSIRLPHCRAPS